MFVGRGTIAQTTMSINQNEQSIIQFQPSKSMQNDSFIKKESQQNKRIKFNDESDEDIQRPSFSMNLNNDNKANEIQTNRIPHTGFIIYEMMNDSQSTNILQTSAAKQGAVIKFEPRASESVPNTIENVVTINGKIYSSIPITTNKKDAKTQAFDKALEYARKIHYTIKVCLPFR